MKVSIVSSCGHPLGSGTIVHWTRTVIRTKAGGSTNDRSWPSEYAQAPAVVLETDRGFSIVPLADRWGQATITKEVPDA